MASFTLLPLELLPNIRDHLVKPSDILTLTTLNRKTSTYLKYFLYSTIIIHQARSPYEGPRDKNGNLKFSDVHPVKERVLKLQTTLHQEPCLESNIKTLDIHLHTGATCMTAGNEIYTLLTCLHHLKHFRLIVEILDHPTAPPAKEKLSPARLAIVLKYSTCQTLETLELALGRDSSHTDETALGDLKSFVALKELSVQSYVLLGGYGVERTDHNYSSEPKPMLSDILPANLLHLRIHCGGAKDPDANCLNNVNCANNVKCPHCDRWDREESVAHLTAPVDWGTKDLGTLEKGITPAELEHGKRFRMLKNVRKCYCLLYGDEDTTIRELVRLADRLNVAGEDDNPSPQSSAGLADS